MFLDFSIFKLFEGNGSKPEVIQRIESIMSAEVQFYEVDVRDKDAIRAVFKKVRSGSHCTKPEGKKY